MSRAGIAYAKWSKDQDFIITETMARAVHQGIGREAAFLACTEHELLEDRTVKAIAERFYKLKRDGAISPLLLGETEKDKPEDDEPLDLAGMFVEMKKIIRERDELKSKYEDALNWKIQYEEIKRKLAKIERESASFMELLRKKA